MKLSVSVIIATFLLSVQGFSEELIPDQCVYFGITGTNLADNSSFATIVSDFNLNLVANESQLLGLTCQEIKTLKEGLFYTNAVLVPLSLMMATNPELGAALSVQALTLGLTNPVVMTVVLVAGAGISTFNMLLYHAQEKCEQIGKDDFKLQIMKAIEEKIKARPINSNVNIELNF